MELTKNDVVIIWGGMKDVGRNESNKELTEIRNFMENNNTYTMVINLPTRQDLEPTSCVSQETKVFNRKLGKYIKCFEHTSVVEIKWDKEHHTRHGLHLNKKGKKLLTNRLVTNIKDLFLKIQRTPILMTWSEGQEGKLQRETTKVEDKGASKMSRELTNQSKGKPTILATLKDDQEIQNIRKKAGGTNTEDNQV
jgi:RNase H-fold protein (predicted Holliday junction resolvase)